MKTKRTLKSSLFLVLLFLIPVLKVKSQTWAVLDSVFNTNSVTVNDYDFSDNGTYGTIQVGWGYRYTSDAASTWSPYKDPTPSYAMFTCFNFYGSQTTVYAGTDRGFYDKSNDGGTTWTQGPQLFNYTCYINDIDFNGNNGITVTSDGEVAYTTDGGGNWTTLATRPNGSLAAITTLEMPSSTIAYMGGSGLFMKTTDGGQTWADVTGGITSGSISSLSFSSVTNGCAVVYPGGPPNQLWKTTDGGTSWTQISTVPLVSNEIYCVNNNLFFAAAGDNIYKSTDAGSTWTIQYTGATGCNPHGLKFIGASGYALISASGGTKIVRNFNLLSSVSENILPESIKIFPSPATNKITLETELSAKSNTVSILNIQGQEILKQVVTTTKTVIDISDLSKGIYFIKYENENGSDTQKLIKQ
ncbi:MAG: hypothetical protein A3F72_07760 [Bacteroidetes bacterium RIFCSPLOWO2_12_FULL_35_15]|nr:MAG: hypothetical protein A3F72_07760 [Bacteroidetes bacterium RIFCSPLOWO2_12_FULL_35_15]